MKRTAGDKTPTSSRTQGGARHRPAAPKFFATASQFRAWLERNHASATELVVGFHKVDSGRRSIKWPESVDEALCFGWIDGVRKRIDQTSYQIRFSPRRKNSVWSAINVRKMTALIAANKARAAGLAAYENRSHQRTGIYSFEQQRPAAFQPTQLRRIRQNRKAWQFFQALPPGHRRTITHWVLSAKQPATRDRRLAQLIEACSERRRLLK